MARWLNKKLTIPLPEDEYERIKKYPHIKWGAVARKAVIEYAAQLDKLEELKEKPKEDKK